MVFHLIFIEILYTLFIIQEELMENWNEIESGSGNIKAIAPLR